MADVIAFDQFLKDLFDPAVGHDLSAGNTTVLKCAVIDSTTTPSQTTSDPRWGAGGGTNFSTWEVTAAGDYTAGGNTLASPLVTLSGGILEIDWGNPADWTTGTDTDAKWGIVYNDFATKQCICYIDLGTAFDMSTGTLRIEFGTPAMQLNQTP